MELNTVTNQYYITVDDVVTDTTYSSAELGNIFKDDIDKSLKVISKSIYRLIYDYYKGLYKSDHITFMQTKIENNVNNEQTYLKQAMLEQVIGAIESGMDLNPYINEPKKNYSFTVYEELRNGFLLDKSRKHNDET